MPGKEYEHYLHLSKEDLLLIIRKKDNENKQLQNRMKELKILKEKYYSYNMFHMEEIARLDKVIGQYKGLRK